MPLICLLYTSADNAPGTPAAQHLVLSSGEYARGSANSFPAGRLGHPHWLNFVRVADAAATAAKAVSLGGQVLSEPHLDRHGGRIAILADPAGARFGVMEWTENDSGEAAK